MPDQNYNTRDGLTRVDDGPGGVWVTYYSDHSGVRVHEDKMSAYIAAVEATSQVVFVPFDQDVWDAVRDQRSALQ